MPNWYSGTVTISGNIKRFQEWYKKHKDSENGLENSFAQTFVPLSSGEWNYDRACCEWGTKWDLGNITIHCGEEDEDEVFVFSFDSAWSPPIYLWKQLEKRYDVEVTEFGYEEQQLEFHKYENGRDIWVECDDEWFVKNYGFIPSNEALKDEELYDDELRDFKYDNWCDALDDWQATVKHNNPNWKTVADSYDEQ